VDRVNISIPGDKPTEWTVTDTESGEMIPDVSGADVRIRMSEIPRAYLHIALPRASIVAEPELRAKWNGTTYRLVPVGDD